MNAVTLSIFQHLFASVAEEMGVTLERAAYSPNIKERLDFSCALFLGDSRLLAQAAHIPVHLGAMPASVQAAIARRAPFQPGDLVILNDPYQGGNHLPDITLVSPVFIGQEKEASFFVASRAHHADIGGMSPGSMPLSTELYQEGLIIPPIKLVERGERNQAVWELILRNTRAPQERAGDLAAQLAAHATGARRLNEIIARYGQEQVMEQAGLLIDYAKSMAAAALSHIPNGRYAFTDYLDDDGQGSGPLPIQAAITVHEEQLEIDFAGTAPAARGNVNAVPAIVESAAAYCLHCIALALLPVPLPMNQGLMELIKLRIPPGSLLNPHPPHAVAAGNVETSQRIVDVILGALAQALPDLIPAASQGGMNNLSFGGATPAASPDEQPTPFAYYETIGGGSGAGPHSDGGSGLHVHMSNTRNTPIEALEYSFPLRVIAYRLRYGSGGAGRQRGGDGLVRAIQFLCPVTVTLNTERRVRPPYGLRGGQPGACGENKLIRNGQESLLPGKISLDLRSGDQLAIATPGGGGWGPAEDDNGAATNE